MENNRNIKYTSEEILQILIDFYNFQANFDSEVGKGEILTFQTTIKEWRSICDLLEPDKLAIFYHKLFELKTNQADLVDILSKEDRYTLRELCDYIALNAIKEKISPIMSLGTSCQEAAVFKALKRKLEEKGIDTKDFKPSAEFIPFFKKHASDLVEVISKLAPGSLTNYKIKENIISRLGSFLFLIAIVFLIIVSIMYKFTWFLLIPLSLSLLLLFIGNKIKYSKYEVGEYNTIRDLIIGMKSKIY